MDVYTECWRQGKRIRNLFWFLFAGYVPVVLAATVPTHGIGKDAGKCFAAICRAFLAKTACSRERLFYGWNLLS
jgi:hypothetical protein